MTENENKRGNKQNDDTHHSSPFPTKWMMAMMMTMMMYSDDNMYSFPEEDMLPPLLPLP